MIGGVAGGLGEYFDIRSYLSQNNICCFTLPGGNRNFSLYYSLDVVPEEPWTFNMGPGERKKEDSNAGTSQTYSG